MFTTGNVINNPNLTKMTNTPKVKVQKINFMTLKNDKQNGIGRYKSNIKNHLLVVYISSVIHLNISTQLTKQLTLIAKIYFYSVTSLNVSKIIDRGI